jgi:hypothetical protein
MMLTAEPTSCAPAIANAAAPTTSHRNPCMLALWRRPARSCGEMRPSGLGLVGLPGLLGLGSGLLQRGASYAWHHESADMKQDIFLEVDGAPIEARAAES